jgi:hypothetical protein
MKRIHFLAPGILLLAACSGSSTPSTTLHNEDFRWTITIPAGFESVEPDEWAKVQGKGQAAMENSTGLKIDNQTTGIFVFKSGQTNYFESNQQSFDEAVDGDHRESTKLAADLLYETFVSQMPGVKIDSSMVVETIDGLEFLTTKMKLDLPNGMIMYMEMYSRLFDKRELAVNIIYIDEKKGQQMKDSWYQSKFSK